MLDLLVGKWLRAAITITASCGFLLIGYDQGVMGGIITAPTFEAQFDNPSATMQGIISAIYDLGCFAGAVFMFVLGERLGRKRSLRTGMIIVCLGVILQCSSYERAQLLVGRFVTGFGNGINTGALPVFQSELVSHKTRGRYVIILCGGVIAGLAISNWLCYGASYATSSLQWRFPIAFQSVFALFVLGALPFLPETPRWLISHGKTSDATTVYARLQNAPETDEKVQAKMEEILAVHRFEQSIGQQGWMEIFRNGEGQSLRRMLLGAMPQFCQQMSGINGPSYYLPLLLQTSVGLSHNLALILSAVAACNYCIFTYAPLFYIDSFGRRPTMIIGCFACAICMIVMAITNGVGGHGPGIVTTVFFFLFYDAFAMSYMAICWLYASEINSLHMRNKGNAMALVVNWLCNFLVVMITPYAVDRLKYKFYILWAVFNMIFGVMSYLFMIETAGKSLEEIDGIFERNRGWIAKSKEERTRFSLGIVNQSDNSASTGSDYKGDAEVQIKKGETHHVENSL